MSAHAMKRATAFAVTVCLLLPYLPSAVAATQASALPPMRIGATPPAPTLGAAPATASHLAGRWERIADLARQSQGKGGLEKSSAQAFLREPVDVARITQEVLRESDGLSRIAIDLEQQFARDEAYLRTHRMPQVLFDRHAKAWSVFRETNTRLGDAIADLARAEKINNHDAKKGALESIGKIVGGMPSAKSFQPAKAAALAREGSDIRARQPLTTSAEMRVAIEGPQEKSAAKVAPAAPGPADLAETIDVKLTPKIRELAQSLNNNPVAISNWVRNNIDFLPTYGSIQGAELARINKRGNATDTSSLLIALLRAANVPARYVYGTVEMPIESAQNWLQGVNRPDQVVELMTKGGIPAASVISGGRIVAVRFEHIWVEAFVDFHPPRAAVNRTPAVWTPIDASFKTYDVKPPIDLIVGAPFDAAGLAAQLDASATKSANGAVTGVDLDIATRAYDAYRPAARAYANQVRPNARVVDVRGTATIIPTNPPLLAGALPFTQLARSNTYAELPRGLRHYLKLSYFATESDYTFDSASLIHEIPLAQVGLSTIGVDYVPATQADRDIVAQLRRDNAESLSPYLINVIPQVQIEGAAVASAAAVEMGRVQYWKADITDPQGIFPPAFAANRITAGSHVAFVVDGAGVTTDMVQKRLDLIPEGVSYPTREGLQQAGLHFWMLRDETDQNWASQFKGKVTRLPSVGAFSAPLQVTYAFGVARSGQFAGYQTDIKRNLYAAVNDTQAQQVNMFTLIGNTGSLLESMVWEMLNGKELSTGVSTAKILAVANSQRIPVYFVDSSNVGAVISLLQISADAKQEIQNAVSAGKRVVVPEREVTVGKWRGTGYVIQDPQTGVGVYQIDGGLSGGVSFGCVLKALLDSNLFVKLLNKQLARFKDQLWSAAAKSALFAPAGAIFATATALSAQYVWFLAFQFATIDFAEMVASGEAEAFMLGLLACSSQSSCSGSGTGPMAGGNPVVYATGEKLQVENDYVGAGDDRLDFTRVYLSFAPVFGTRMGNHWRHNFERSIHVPPATTGTDENGAPIGSGYSVVADTGVRAPAQLPAIPPPAEAVLAFRGDGSYVQYNLRAGAYSAPLDVPEALTREKDASGRTTGWVYLSVLDETERFDAQGKLVSITNRQGMVKTLTYNPDGSLAQVRNQFGRTLTFTYNAEGDVETLTDPAGGVWRYSYDSYANLETVTHADLKTRRYHYEQSPSKGLLTGITDERGNRWSTYRYDFQNRVVDESHAGGANRLTLVYEGDLRTRITDALGTTRVFDFEKVFETKRLAKVTEPCAFGCGAAGGVSEASYDANGYLASSKDFNGNQVSFSRDVRGLERSRTDAIGSPVARTLTTEYDPQWRVVTRATEPTTAGSRVTVNTLDARGNVKTKAVTVAGETRTWTFDYNSLGQKILADGPRTDITDTTTWTYFPNGDLETMTDAAGNVVRYGAYDGNGRPGTMTDANGLVTTMTYDPRGRLKTSSAAGELTQYEYDGVGNLEKFTLPDGTFLRYGYDSAQRLTSITDSLGNSITYTLDDVGKRKKEETKDPSNALAKTKSRVFDGLSRVKEMRGATNQLTVYGYDLQGNLKTATDPLIHVTVNDFDALNRLKKVTEPQLVGFPVAGEIAFGYDAQDNLTSVTDQRGLQTIYAYSGFDEVKRLTSPDTGVTDYTYDPAGNVKTAVDSRGQNATYTYDALNRLKTLTYSDESLVFTYDDLAISPNSKARLSKVTDGSGSTTYGYDAQGRITSKIQVTGTVTRQVGYGFSASGQLATIATPSGQTIAYGYTNDQVTSVTVNGVDVLTNAKYFPFGGLQKWTWGNGQSYERVYDLDGRIKSVTIGGVVRSYGFDDASRITGLEDKQGTASLSTVAVGYDNLDRLTSANQTGAGAFAQTFGYDLVGNRTSQTVDGISTILSYGSASNRLTQIGSQVIGYDNAGNTSSDGSLTYLYSGRNRLIEVKSGASTVAAYKHNAFGERVTKTVSGVTRVFQYDEDGHLLGEYSGSGSLIQETVWIDDTPVAMLQPKVGGGIDIRYVWADQLDTPRAVSTNDAVASILWNWNSDPFGITTAAGSIEYNLRFPGQYFDAEVQTHYNYFRDYSPATGRFQQSDPIGLLGGLNSFAYVHEPFSWIDPFGLAGYGKGVPKGTPIPGEDGALFCWVNEGKRHTTNKTLKKRWSEDKDKPWPPDPGKPGRKGGQEASHEIALYQGGPDHVCNIAPRTQQDHQQRHKERCDFRGAGKKK